MRKITSVRVPWFTCSPSKRIDLGLRQRLAEKASGHWTVLRAAIGPGGWPRSLKVAAGVGTLGGGDLLGNLSALAMRHLLDERKVFLHQQPAAQALIEFWLQATVMPAQVATTAQ